MISETTCSASITRKFITNREPQLILLLLVLVLLLVKAFLTVRLLAATFQGLLCSFLLTCLGWNMLIERKAFHCTDDGLPFDFWTSIETHRGAGDRLGPGWTWAKLEAAQIAFQTAFFTVWFAGGFCFLKLVPKEPE